MHHIHFYISVTWRNHQVHTPTNIIENISQEVCKRQHKLYLYFHIAINLPSSHHTLFKASAHYNNYITVYSPSRLAYAAVKQQQPDTSFLQFINTDISTNLKQQLLQIQTTTLNKLSEQQPRTLTIQIGSQLLRQLQSTCEKILIADYMAYKNRRRNPFFISFISQDILPQLDAETIKPTAQVADIARNITQIGLPIHCKTNPMHGFKNCLLGLLLLCAVYCHAHSKNLHTQSRYIDQLQTKLQAISAIPVTSLKLQSIASLQQRLNTYTSHISQRNRHAFNVLHENISEQTFKAIARILQPYFLQQLKLKHLQLHQSETSLTQYLSYARLLWLYNSSVCPNTNLLRHNNLALSKLIYTHLPIDYQSMHKPLSIEQIKRLLQQSTAPAICKAKPSAAYTQAQHDLAAHFWDSNPMLRGPLQRDLANKILHLYLASALQPLNLKLNKILPDTVLTSKLSLRAFNRVFQIQPHISEHNGLHKNPMQDNKLFTIQHYYRRQYIADWQQWISSWQLNKQLMASHNIDAIRYITAPHSAFIQALNLAHARLAANTFDFKQIHLSIPHHTRHLTAWLHFRHTNTAMLTTSKPTSQPGWEAQLSAYRTSLQQLYLATQPLLRQQTPPANIITYTQKIFSDRSASTTFGKTIHVAQQLSQLLKNKASQHAMQHVLMLPLDLLWQQLMPATLNAINQLWHKNIFTPYQYALANNYPCNRHAQIDADPQLLWHWLFAQHTPPLDFLKNNLAPWLKDDNLPAQLAQYHKLLRAHFSPATTALLPFLQQINQLYTINNGAPGLDLAIHPTPSPWLAKQVISLGATNIAYSNGPPAWKYFLSQLNTATGYSSINLTLQNHSTQLLLHHEGLYAALRLLQAAHWSCPPTYTQCYLSWHNPLHPRQGTRIILRSPTLRALDALLHHGVVLPRTLADDILITARSHAGRGAPS